MGEQEMLPCPWCGEAPQVKEGTFVFTDTMKWGAVQCCGTGPDVRTGYRRWEDWAHLAIDAWNDRQNSNGGE